MNIRAERGYRRGEDEVVGCPGQRRTHEDSHEDSSCDAEENEDRVDSPNRESATAAMRCQRDDAKRQLRLNIEEVPADRNGIAWPKYRGAMHALVVDEGAVGAVLVVNGELALDVKNEGVSTGHLRVVQNEVVAWITPNSETAYGHQNEPANGVVQNGLLGCHGRVFAERELLMRSLPPSRRPHLQVGYRQPNNVQSLGSQPSAILMAGIAQDQSIAALLHRNDPRG